MYLHELFLIRPDLRHEETIIQTANCLERLTNIINEVFDKIDRRVENNCNRIKSLNSRSNAVRKKINSLTGINKATIIFSPVRFPTVLNLNENNSVEKYKIEKNTQKSDMQFLDGIKFEASARRSISDKSKFYYVDKPDRLYNCYKSFPYYTETINSLLLFNTQKNIYAKHSMNDDCTKSKKKTTDKSSVPFDMVRMEPSSIPILNRNMSTRKVNEDLFYTPGFFMAPELDLPQYLPDLPGIADDIEYNVDDSIDTLVQKPIATVNRTIDIPEIAHQTTDTTSENVEINNITKRQDTRTNQSAMVAEVPQIISPPPPPPPPPPPMLPKSATVNADSQKPDDRSALLNSIRSGKTLRKVDRYYIKEKAIVDDSNPHSSLMASIRQAGGAEKAKLRAITLGAEKQQTNTSTGSGDLMADLHKKLALRRKGISGTKQENSKIVTDTLRENVQGFNLIDSISSMIPVPLNNTKEINESDDNSDWD